MKEFQNLTDYTNALVRTSTEQLPVGAMTELLIRSNKHSPKTIDGAFALKQLMLAVEFATKHNEQLQARAREMQTETFKQENIEGYGI